MDSPLFVDRWDWSLGNRQARRFPQIWETQIRLAFTVRRKLHPARLFPGQPRGSWFKKMLTKQALAARWRQNTAPGRVRFHALACDTARKHEAWPVKNLTTIIDAGACTQAHVLAVRGAP